MLFDFSTLYPHIIRTRYRVWSTNIYTGKLELNLIALDDCPDFSKEQLKINEEIYKHFQIQRKLEQLDDEFYS